MDKDRKLKILENSNVDVETEVKPMEKTSKFAHANQTNPIFSKLVKFSNTNKKFSIKDFLR